MAKKNFLLGFGLLAMVILVIAFPMATRAQETGNENFIFINYIGQELLLDLDDVTYVVPGTDTAPEGGRLALQLADGWHKYAANAPGVPTGSAGEFNLAPGVMVTKAARLEQTSLRVDENGLVVEVPEDYVYVFDFDPFAAPEVTTPAVDIWQPAAVAPNQGSLVWVNYHGSDELTVDLAGKLYKVPAQSNNIPGRLQLDLDPGFYRYTVSVPHGSLNGEVTVVPGQVIALNISVEVDEKPEEEYDLGDVYEAPTITVHLAEEDLTGQVSPPSAPASAPPVLPVTGGEVMPVFAEIENTPGLLIKNYAGDTLIFTINNQTYTIANNAEQTLDLPPSEYNYTASQPFAATTGTVDLCANPNVELSIVLDVSGDFLTVYQN
ncbi:MAG: hypothetical protein JXM69_16780 [Anaerolineae bacterium]|nr:hypothetical protein [Anaerolineae bacterium]